MCTFKRTPDEITKTYEISFYKSPIYKEFISLDTRKLFKIPRSLSKLAALRHLDCDSSRNRQLLPVIGAIKFYLIWIGLTQYLKYNGNSNYKL